MNRDILSIIAASELLGGICVLSGYAMIPLTGYRLEPAWQAAPGLAFGVFAMASGVALLRRKRWGVSASIAVQLLQLVSVSIVSRVRYVALAGPVAQLIVATTGVRLEAGGGGAFVAVPWSLDGTLGSLGTQAQAGFGVQPSPLAESEFTMAVNLVAFYFLWRLSDYLGRNGKPLETVIIAPAA
jgi:hypothetical protein